MKRYYIEKYNRNTRSWQRGTRGHRTKQEAEMVKGNGRIVVK